MCYACPCVRVSGPMIVSITTGDTGYLDIAYLSATLPNVHSMQKSR